MFGKSPLLNDPTGPKEEGHILFHFTLSRCDRLAPVLIVVNRNKNASAYCDRGERTDSYRWF